MEKFKSEKHKSAEKTDNDQDDEADIIDDELVGSLPWQPSWAGV